MGGHRQIAKSTVTNYNRSKRSNWLSCFPRFAYRHAYRREDLLGSHEDIRFRVDEKRLRTPRRILLPWFRSDVPVYQSHDFLDAFYVELSAQRASPRPTRRRSAKTRSFPPKPPTLWQSCLATVCGLTSEDQAKEKGVASTRSRHIGVSYPLLFRSTRFQSIVARSGPRSTQPSRMLPLDAVVPQHINRPPAVGGSNLDSLPLSHSDLHGLFSVSHPNYRFAPDYLTTARRTELTSWFLPVSDIQTTSQYQAQPHQSRQNPAPAEQLSGKKQIQPRSCKCEIVAPSIQAQLRISFSN